jgi:hypothetical protein
MGNIAREKRDLLVCVYVLGRVYTKLAALPISAGDRNQNASKSAPSLV